ANEVLRLTQVRRWFTAHRLPAKWYRPARIVVFAFAAVIAMGTVLLLLPAATAPGKSTDLVTALFTSTSAVCFTGLVVVDTPTHWSTFGELILLGLIQI